MKTRKSLPALLPLCLAVMLNREAMALGIGEARLDSTLGKPLQARIPVFSAKGLDETQLNIKILPSYDSDATQSISDVSSLKLSVETSLNEDGKGIIYLSSPEPIREPFLDFTVQVRWPQGSIQREYTLLFDLPGLVPVLAPVAVPVKTAAAQISPRSYQPGTTSTSSRSEIKPKPAPGKIPPLSDNHKRYLIRRGDSLWGIAGSLSRERGVSRQLLMDQLFALNPSVFIRGDRSLIAEGKWLNIDAAQLAAVLNTAPVEPSAQFANNAGAEALSTDAVLVVNEAALSADGTALSTDKTALSDSSTELASSSALPQTLAEVQAETEQVSQGIVEMSAKLQALQIRLAKLQEEYQGLKELEAGLSPESSAAAGNNDAELLAIAALENVASSANNAEPVAATNVANVISVEGAGGAEPSAVDEEPLAVDVEPSAVDEEPMSDDTAVLTVGDEGSTAGWNWWWIVVGAGVVLALWARRRSGTAKPVTSREPDIQHFSSNAVAGSRVEPVKTGIDDSVFDNLAAETAAKPVVASAKSWVSAEPSPFEKPDDSVFAELSKLPVAGAPATSNSGDTSAFEEELIIDDSSFEAPSLEDSVFEDTVFDDLVLDDAVLDGSALADSELKGKAEPSAALINDFELSSFDELGLDFSDDALDTPLDDAFAERAAACIASGDYEAARPLLEKQLAQDEDNVEVQLSLLDTYAHLGLSEEFESLALQLEFNESLNSEHQLDAMRELLQENTGSLSVVRSLKS
ncbi:hypothetical protein IB286_09040 [Spongiibacter sp. KMU-158]|uniref:FimV N-terminal domain-containing protein n=1 Tax=Spongiibacter pelagi TaxID=2760804 RepID=A0A927C3I8_9GAMM|nr:tetratricopeptide repeat protein [Spongiibacter pelagi]MBD2859152.1 hypothetical protein [Spongiibacter pelagi]